jgi:hypothetical protein
MLQQIAAYQSLERSAASATRLLPPMLFDAPGQLRGSADIAKGGFDA